MDGENSSSGRGQEAMDLVVYMQGRQNGRMRYYEGKKNPANAGSIQHFVCR
jgi:hypothetical protein